MLAMVVAFAVSQQIGSVSRKELIPPVPPEPLQSHEKSVTSDVSTQQPTWSQPTQVTGGAAPVTGSLAPACCVYSPPAAICATSSALVAGQKISSHTTSAHSAHVALALQGGGEGDTEGGGEGEASPGGEGEADGGGDGEADGGGAGGADGGGFTGGDGGAHAQSRCQSGELPAQVKLSAAEEL